MRLWITALILFNLIDTVSTAFMYQIGGLFEANPLMRAIIDISPGWAMVIKTSFCLLLVPAWIEGKPIRPQFATLLKVTVVIYTALMLWHLFSWIRYMQW